MKHVTQGDLGQPISAVQTQEAACDKWAILNDLTTAAEDFELSHRTLGVLKALLSFLPSRIIGTDPRGNTVFPANRTLSQRLNGMPESTLRRHLARLVDLGIVSRRDSANRKRFARNLGRAGEMAFGFDLTPLATLSHQIRSQAVAAQARAEELRALRDEIALLRQELLMRDGPSEVTETARKLLRRKPILATLTAQRDALIDRIAATAPDQMSASDSQNERHIQVKLQYTSEAPTPVSPKKETADNQVSLTRVITAFDAWHSFFPQPIRHWTDLQRVAEQLAPMIGIDRPVFAQALQRMGAETAAIAVLFILENLDSIQNPGGYLRRMMQNDAQGRGDLAETLVNRPKSAKLSADNRENHRKSARYGLPGGIFA